ncbi:hypothetical protein KM043_013186 [Ampulex compressa]|nr:hypothetical protein KM043_013186 [Ampulex compressa]
MLYVTTIQVPGEFFISQDMPADPQSFLEKFREHMREVRPSPTAHHNKARMFLQRNFYNCSHVHLRNDPVKPPLEPPYSGLHKVIKRLDDRRFVIDVNREHKTVAIEKTEAGVCNKRGKRGSLTG